MSIEKRRLKPYHGILLLVLCLGVLLGVSPILGARFGLYGSLVGELLFLVLSIGIVIVFRGDMKKVFPVKRPKLAPFFGSILLWGGTIVGGITITIILSYFFPKEVLGVSQELGSAFTSVPFLISFIIVAISPAICEEALFRGVVLNSFSGFKSKWIGIIIAGVIFGLFHGSLWRFAPTALLGIMFGYIVTETNNLFYSGMLHFLNNGFSLAIVYLSQKMLDTSGIKAWSDLSIDHVPLMSVASYLILGSGIPLCIYIGNYLIHKDQAGYQEGLFPKSNKKVVITIVALTVAIFLIGMVVMGIAFVVDKDYVQQMIQQQL